MYDLEKQNIVNLELKLTIKKKLPCGTDTINIQPDSTSSLADHSTVFKSLVDTFNGIALHANKET
jgi:hypothetical protein